MIVNEYNEIIQKQKAYYKTGVTRSIKFRKTMLLRLKKAILNNTTELMEATYLDLGKSEYEVITTEIGIVIADINSMVKNLSKWDQKKKVKTNSYNYLGQSYIMNEPYGNTLIISPWNYPFQLALSPLVGAIGGGNCAILKTSEFSVHTSKVIKDIISEIFKPEYIKVIHGGVPETSELLDNRFDLIFFTGSPKVGKIVMEKAAQFLTPVVLELGGKSPIVIHKDTDIKLATKRLIFGKGLNAGQTCIAPDYLLIHEDIKDEFYKTFEKYVKKIYGTDYSRSKNFGKIINERNFDRVIGYLDDGNIVYGGKYNREERHIPLTLLEVDDMDKSVMKDEIFGPILPVITYKKYKDIIHTIDYNPDPLAMYIFSESEKLVHRLLKDVHFGGGCINDTIMHITNEDLPFGGRGTSGIGSYHGKNSYETFTHQKSVLHAQTKYELSLKYPPFSKATIKLLKGFMLK